MSGCKKNPCEICRPGYKCTFCLDLENVSLAEQIDRRAAKCVAACAGIPDPAEWRKDMEDERKAHAETRARLEEAEAACAEIRRELADLLGAFWKKIHPGHLCRDGRIDAEHYRRVQAFLLEQPCGQPLLDELARLRDENEKLRTQRKP